MNAKRKNISYLVVLVSFLLVLFVYFFVFQKYNEKTDELEIKTAQLKSEIHTLQEMESKLGNFEEKKAEMEAAMQEVLESYPVYLQFEDVVGQVNKMSEQVDYASDISVSTQLPVLLYQTGAISQLPVYSLYQKNIQYGMQTSYQGMKDVIHYMQENVKEESISTINVAFDEGTGLVNLSFEMGQYFLTGTEKIYEDIAIPDVSIGTHNIFGETSNGKPKEEVFPSEEELEEESEQEAEKEQE